MPQQEDTANASQMNATQQPAARPQRKWLADIERLKGLAIILVVWGHTYDAAFPVWAIDLRQAIYAFHMPLFMFLSGYVFVYVGAHKLKGSLATYTAKRAKRLLIPFFIMAAIVIFAKFFAGQFVSVDKPVNDLLLSVQHVFIHTEQSPSMFVWYLIVLFYFSIGTTFLFSRMNVSLNILFAASIIMFGLHVFMFYNDAILDYVYINRIFMFYAFFMTGCVACLHKDAWEPFVERYFIPGAAVFLVLLYISFNSEWRYFLVGMTSLVVFHGLIRSRLFNQSRFLEFIGQNAFAIYLLNTIFVGGVKAVFGRFFSVSDQALLLLVGATIAGVVGPIIVKYVISRIGSLRPIAAAME